MASVELHVEDSIGVITFQRPEAMNALNREVIGSLAKIVAHVSKQPDISVLILTGAGEKAFIAGADIQEMQPMSPVEANEFSSLGQEVLIALERLPIATIAAVNGFALGGGCEVAMACDLIYAADTAKFAQPEVNLGVIPGFGGTQRLLRLVGPQKARELVFTGGMIDAEEAKRIGLVLDVFPKVRLMDEVIAVARQIASKGLGAIGRAKMAMCKGGAADLVSACAIEREQFAQCFSHRDQKEGMSAFLEKRKPVWRGR